MDMSPPFVPRLPYSVTAVTFLGRFIELLVYSKSML